LSEEIDQEVVEEAAPEAAEMPETPAALEAPAARRAPWIAPAWFFFGVIVGVAAFAAYTAFLAPKPAAPAAAVAAIDPAQMREAARAGVLEAIATLQAGGPQQPAAQEQGPQPVSADAFTVRPANRLGEQTASVTVYEFSDFQ
jgi:hypothetical protein